ncbi:MAG: hypothetical protein JST73_13065 [Actinobacteria bacterium]|nr:hypothetical protein [Actinomycetota bacterium]
MTPSASEQEPMSTPHDAESEDAPVASPAIEPNVFVDNRRRRIPGVLYIVIGVVALASWLVRVGHDPVLVNAGMGIAGLLLIALGAWSIFTGTGLDVDEEAALVSTGVAVQHPIGHASAQMGWRGWRSRPTWRILWYSAETPPRRRGLSFVDGHDGTVLDSVVEDNPETATSIDWTLTDGA